MFQVYRRPARFPARRCDRVHLGVLCHSPVVRLNTSGLGGEQREQLGCSRLGWCYATAGQESEQEGVGPSQQSNLHDRNDPLTNRQTTLHMLYTTDPIPLLWTLDRGVRV